MIEMVKGKIVPEFVEEGSDTFSQIYNPDVLLCLANLSNDEVFTPPEVANQMLDMLPQELFESPDTKFLDIKTPTLIQFNYSTAAYLQAG